MKKKRDWLILSSVINSLYLKKFGRQCPGHSEPLACGINSMDEENRKQYDKWRSDQECFLDACEYIYSLEKKLEDKDEYIDELKDELEKYTRF